MNKYAITLLGLLLNFYLVAQNNVLEDAIFLRRLTTSDEGTYVLAGTQEEDDTRLRRVVITYFDPSLEEEFYTAARATAYLSENPFFKRFEVGGEEKSFDDVLGVGAQKARGAGKIANLNITNIAFGLTDFLIARTRSELNIAFFQRLQEAIRQNSDLRALFPQTSHVLAAIGNEIYNYNVYLNTLRIAFDKDLANLLINLPEWLRQKPLEDQYLSAKYALMLGLRYAELAKRQEHPAELIHDLLQNTYCDSLLQLGAPKLQNELQGLRVIDLLSQSLRTTYDENNQRYWVEQEEVEKLSDPLTMRIYLGLLYQRIQGDPVYQTITFRNEGVAKTLLMSLTALAEQEEVAELEADFSSIYTYLLKVQQQTEALGAEIKSFEEAQQDIRNLSMTPKERQRLQLYASTQLLSASVSFLRQVYLVRELPLFPGLTEKSLPERDSLSLVSLLSAAGELAASITNRQYTMAVTQAAMLIDYLSGDESMQDNAVFTNFLKYGTFMANLLEAESPESVQAVIEAAALPPGSYSVKRYGRFNVSLNAYLGAFGGHERIEGERRTGKLNNLALTAPVGVYAGWGMAGRRAGASQFSKPWSLGFFVPLIDVGTLASFRLDDRAVDVLPTITLGQIFAPGLFAELGIAGTPLSLGIGGQVGPRLRKFEADLVDLGETYFRWGASLKVDIPIFTLVHRPAQRIK